MSTSRNLKERRDVNNADIPDIIERAETLRQAAEQQRAQNANRSTIEDVQKVGRELSIPDIFVEQAIEELAQERRPNDEPEEGSIDQDTVLEPEVSRKNSRLIPTTVIAAVIAFMLSFVFTQWFNDTDEGSEEKEATEPTVVVHERVIKETVIKEVQIVREVERIVEVPAKETLPPETAPRIEPMEEHVDPPPQNQKTTETTDDVTPRLKEESEKVETQDVVSLPNLLKAIEGEWLLDSYLLYEQGVELPMEIPVNFEPLELPKTWRFSKGRYKRVMDSTLSFSAKYRVIALPKNLQPIVDEEGQWGQIEASNVVSSIPGIRRQNDYFAVFVGEQSIAIWYLGPNAYRKKLPSQAERYIRK
jgi:hypothetical protein